MTEEATAPREEAELAELFEFIESIPESVIEEGDVAVATYVEEWRSVSVEPSGSLQAAAIGDVTKCAGAILLALGTAAIPASKFLKLKRFIKEAGGVRKAAKLLLQVIRGEKQLEELGTTLAALGAELLEINAIKENCGGKG